MTNKTYEGDEDILTREIKFEKSSYGSLDLKFYLKDSKGIIQFCISTGWNDDTDPGNPANTYDYDIGYYSPLPKYDDHKPMDSCQFYDKCYYDGSTMYAKEVFKKLVHYGEEAVWRELEKSYNQWLLDRIEE